MPHAAAETATYDLVVRPLAETTAGTDRWTWAVTAADRVAARGEAPNPHAAQRCGELTAAALGAFGRIGRRRF